MNSFWRPVAQIDLKSDWLVSVTRVFWLNGDMSTSRHFYLQFAPLGTHRVLSYSPSFSVKGGEEYRHSAFNECCWRVAAVVYFYRESYGPIRIKWADLCARHVHPRPQLRFGEQEGLFGVIEYIAGQVDLLPHGIVLIAHHLALLAVDAPLEHPDSHHDSSNQADGRGLKESDPKQQPADADSDDCENSRRNGPAAHYSTTQYKQAAAVAFLLVESCGFATWDRRNCAKGIGRKLKYAASCILFDRRPLFRRGVRYYRVAWTASNETPRGR